MFYVHTVLDFNNQYTIQQMLCTAWYFTLRTGYLDDILLDHMESRRMFVYIFHTYKNNQLLATVAAYFYIS